MNDFDDYLNLPEDPELAFVEYERRLRKQMWAEIGNENNPISYVQDQKVCYVMKLMGFHDAHGFSFFELPALLRSSNYFDESFDSFTDKVNYWTTQLGVSHAKRLRPISTILQLTPKIRQQLHSYTIKIRAILTPMELPANKKEALLSKLGALEFEIDTDRTKTEAWTAFVLEICSAGGKAARELKPIKDISDSIGNLLGKAKKFADQLGLPSPESPKRLEPPKKQLPEPMDDEIPF